MGNKILGEYDVSKDKNQIIGTAGVGMAWKMYNGVSKKTKEKVTIHVLQKDDLPKKLRNDQFYKNVIAKEVSTLAKLRHPHILRVLHPIDEASAAFVMVTEPVVGSLANLLKDHTNLPKPSERLAELQAQLCELDLKNGLRQLAEALIFAHRDAKMYHRFLEPENIYITPSGDWKLGGWYYSRQVNNKGDKVKHDFDYAKDITSALFAFPSFKFVAPELTEATAEHDEKADVWALAKIAYTAHRYLANVESKEAPPKDLQSYQSACKAMFAMSFDGVPAALVDTLKKMLQLLPAQRCELGEFLASAYFNDLLVRTLRYLDTLYEKDANSRMEFLKRLPQALPLFDKGSAQRRLLPMLLQQMRDEAVSLFVLPSVLIISKQLEASSPLWSNEVLPALVREMEPGKPHAVMFVLIKNLDQLMNKSGVDIQNSHVIPMVMRCLESKEVALVVEALKSLSPLANEHKFPYRVLKDGLLPRLLLLASEPGPLAVRVQTLMTISQIFALYDTDSVLELLGVLEVAVKVDRTPPVIMCCTGVYDAVSKSVGAEITAQHILPKLIPLSMDAQLNLQQYSTVFKVVSDMTARMGKSRLEQLQKKADMDKQKSDGAGLMESATNDDPFQRMDTVSQMSDMMKKDFSQLSAETKQSASSPASQQQPQPQQPSGASWATNSFSGWGDFDSSSSSGSGSSGSGVESKEMSSFMDKMEGAPGGLSWKTAHPVNTSPLAASASPLSVQQTPPSAASATASSFGFSAPQPATSPQQQQQQALQQQQFGAASMASPRTAQQPSPASSLAPASMGFQQQQQPQPQLQQQQRPAAVSASPSWQSPSSVSSSNSSSFSSFGSPPAQPVASMSWNAAPLSNNSNNSGNFNSNNSNTGAGGWGLSSPQPTVQQQPQQQQQQPSSNAGFGSAFGFLDASPAAAPVQQPQLQQQQYQPMQMQQQQLPQPQHQRQQSQPSSNSFGGFGALPPLSSGGSSGATVVGGASTWGQQPRAPTSASSSNAFDGLSFDMGASSSAAAAAAAQPVMSNFGAARSAPAAASASPLGAFGHIQPQMQQQQQQRPQQQQVPRLAPPPGESAFGFIGSSSPQPQPQQQPASLPTASAAGFDFISAAPAPAQSQPNDLFGLGFGNRPAQQQPPQAQQPRPAASRNDFEDFNWQ